MDHAHAQRMDRKYRTARHLYDVTRRGFLWGRDGGLALLELQKEQRLLEIGCGTGRNIARLLRQNPDTRADGIDISRRMLEAAGRRVGEDPRVRLAWADAQDPAMGRLWDAEGYDAVLMSFSLSMVPDWRTALANALTALKPAGKLVVVDFGDFEGWGVAGRWARWSLGRHEAPPLVGLQAHAHQLSARGWRCEHRSRWGGAAQTLVVHRERSQGVELLHPDQ